MINLTKKLATKIKRRTAVIVESNIVMAKETLRRALIFYFLSFFNSNHSVYCYKKRWIAYWLGPRKSSKFVN